MLDVHYGTGQIVDAVDASLAEWEANLQQEDENKDRHPCRYASRLTNKVKEKYHTRTRECRGLMKALEKFRNYPYGIWFLVETDANTLVHQRNVPANDRPGALVTLGLVWIWLFNFGMKHVPGRLNGGHDGLSRQPQGKGQPVPEEEDDLEETIEASLRGIQVEQGSDSQGRERPYELFVWLWLAEEYKGWWNEIGECLGNLKQQEGKTPTVMQQFRREATKYLLPDGVLYPRGKPNEPPAKVLLSTEKRRKAMEAAQKLSGHCGREGTIRKVAERFGGPEMYDHGKDCVKTTKQCKQRAPLQCDEPLKTLTVSHLWQWVGRNILYMLETEDGYHLRVVAREYLSR